MRVGEKFSGIIFPLYAIFDRALRAFTSRTRKKAALKINNNSVFIFICSIIFKPNSIRIIRFILLTQIRFYFKNNIRSPIKFSIPLLSLYEKEEGTSGRTIILPSPLSRSQRARARSTPLCCAPHSYVFNILRSLARAHILLHRAISIIKFLCSACRSSRSRRQPKILPRIHTPLARH